MIDKTKIKGIFLALLFILLVSNSFGYDNLKEKSLLVSELPQSGYYEYEFQPINNGTLLFTSINNSNYINLGLPNSYTFNSNESYKVNISWSIVNTIWANDTILHEGIRVSNDQNNNYYDLGFKFYLIKGEYNTLGLNGSLNNLSIVNGSYVKEITFNNLPDTQNLTFAITGESNESFKLVSCSKYFKCDNRTFNLNSQGYYYLNVEYHLPLETPIGEFHESFNISSSTQNKSIKVLFKVKQPQIFVIPSELEEMCLKPNPTIAEQFECERKLAEYRLELITETHNYFSKVNTEKICDQLIRTEFVVGDSISEEFITANKELRTELKTCENDRLNKGDEVNRLNMVIYDLENEVEQTKLSSDNEVLEIKTQALESTKKVTDESIQYKKNVSKENLSKLNWVFGIMLLLSLLSIIYKYVEEEVNYVKVKYGFTYPVIITLVSVTLLIIFNISM